MILALVCAICLGVCVAAIHTEEFQEALKEPEVAFGPEDAGSAGVIEGRMPGDCGGKIIKGPAKPLDAGSNGVTIMVRDGNDNNVVAKLVLTSELEGDDLVQEKANMANECALMRFLETQGAPHVLRCEGECTGQLQMEWNGNDSLANTPVLITAPFVNDARQWTGMADLDTDGASEKAWRETFYTAAYMVAAGVVNPDMARNVLNAPDGTTTFIDLGQARIIHAKGEDATWKDLGLESFGFVDSNLPFRLKLGQASDAALRTHISDALFKCRFEGEGLGWTAIEEIWRNAWSDAARARTYDVPGLLEAADETLHGLRLLETASFKNAWEDEAHIDDFEAALNAGSKHTGRIWLNFKTESILKAESAVDLSQEFENLEGFKEIADKLKSSCGRDQEEASWSC